MALREIVPGIVTWPWFSERHGYDFNGYVIGRTAVDPVEGELPEVVRVVLTNRNHYRNAARLNARVLVHAADAEFVKKQGVQVAGELRYGDVIDGFEVVDAHGKSPGEIALWNAQRKILVVGDICVGSPPGALKILPAKVIDDMPALHESLRRLAALQPSILLVGDGAPILDNASDALHALVRSLP